MNDGGTLEGNSSASRDNTDSMDITNLLGFENALSQITNNVSPSSVAHANGSASSGGARPLSNVQAPRWSQRLLKILPPL